MKNLLRLFLVLILLWASMAPSMAQYPYSTHTRALQRNSMRTFPLSQPMNRPLTVYVDTDSPLYKAQYLNYVTQSLSEWSNALDGRLTYRFVTQPREGQIRIYWVSRFNNNNTSGETSFRTGDARVEIRTDGVPNNELKGTILHELGHALGISGHSPFEGDVMGAVQSWGSMPSYQPHLTTRDRDAIRLLYSPSWQSGEDLYLAQRPYTQYTPYSAAYTPPANPYYSQQYAPAPQTSYYQGTRSYYQPPQSQQSRASAILQNPYVGTVLNILLNSW